MSGFVSPFSLAYTYKRSLGPILTQFATGLRDGRILGARTPSGRVLVPARECDPDTGASVEAALVPVASVGTVVGCTEAAAPDDCPSDRPFAWSLVKLDGADTPWLHRCVGAVQVGTRVRAVWATERTGAVTDIRWFEPGDGPVDVPARTPAEDEPAEVTRMQVPTRIDYEVCAGTVTQQFLEAILEKRLVGRRCGSCEKVYIPPRGSCPTCARACEEPVEVSQTGTVTTFSVIRIPFEGQMLTPPYACAHIVLDGADVPLLHIVGDCDPDAVQVGMRVTAVWADPVEPTLASVRYFRPADEGA